MKNSSAVSHRRDVVIIKFIGKRAEWDETQCVILSNRDWLASYEYKSWTKLNKSILRESIDYTELEIKSIVYFIIFLD